MRDYSLSLPCSLNVPPLPLPQDSSTQAHRPEGLSLAKSPSDGAQCTHCVFEKRTGLTYGYAQNSPVCAERKTHTQPCMQTMWRTQRHTQLYACMRRHTHNCMHICAKITETVCACEQKHPQPYACLRGQTHSCIHVCTYHRYTLGLMYRTTHSR